MLVLSRRAEQQIAFPGLGITLSILQVRGQIVKIGIVAPPEIAIRRQEHVTESDHCATAVRLPELKDATINNDEVEHRRRNQLNTLQLYFDAIRMRLEKGEQVNAKELVQSLLSALDVDSYEISSTDTSQSSEVACWKVKQRVLVVEDSDNERGLMTYLLASHGFVVYVARDGVEALEQLRFGCGSPDVVLMDINMPFGNGVEALRRFRRDPTFRDLLIYAVTGSRRNPADEPAGRGWDRWFAKPIEIRQLVDAIRDDCSATSPAASGHQWSEVSK